MNATERAAFEAWMRTDGPKLDTASLKPDGRYWSSHTQLMWESWQAARATSGAVPQGWKLVPAGFTNEICCAIEQEIDSQLAASGISALVHRQDGMEVWRAALAAAPQPPAANNSTDWPAEFEKLQTPMGVHLAMLAGTIAKISVRDCAHTHGATELERLDAALAAAQAQPVELPPFDFDTASHTGSRIRGYRAETVQALLAAQKGQP